MPQQTSTNWKTRPVFISSTFKDMGEEREYLNNFVFPELEERLRERRHFLEPIDLRWGVETASVDEEHEKEMLVLKVCLGEIERSRPFLIALMGDRYGWIPPEERMQQATREAGYDHPVKNKSITALEIEYGVLNSADQRKRSFFYIREALPYEDMPAETAALYSDAKAGNKEAAERLLELKEKIKQNPDLKDRVRTYTTGWDKKNQKVTQLEVFGKMVLEDLWQELKEETEKFLQESQTWQDQERALLDEFIEDRTRTFTGREQVLNEIKDFALTPDSENTKMAMCLTGEAGSGKSAIFAQTWQNLQKENVLVLANGAGTGPRSSDVNAMLERWIEEICVFLQTPNPLPEKPSPDDLDQYFRHLLFTAGEKKRVVVLLDALNQLETTNRGLYMTWLPAVWPANTRFVCTAIPGQQTQSLLKKHYAIEKLLPVLPEKDAEAMAKTICQKYHRESNEEVLQTLLGKKKEDGQLASNNPLWLSIAMDELNKLDGDALALADKIYKGTPEENLLQLLLDTVAEMPPTPETLYPYIFTRAEKLFGKAYTQTILTLIAISRKGWCEKDLEELVPKQTGEKWDKLAFANVKRHFRGHLVESGQLGLYKFFHGQMEQAIKQTYLQNPEELKKMYQLAGDYLLKRPKEEPLRTEIMHFYLGTEDKKQLANYYGSKLPEIELKEASQTLAVFITDAKESLFKEKVDWVINWLSYTQQNKPLLIEHIQFNLDAALEFLCKLSEKETYHQILLKAINDLSLQDPGNAGWQRDLSVSYIKLGDIQRAQGFLAEAQKSYKETHDILEKLSLQDPGNAGWQRDLSVSLDKLGDIQSAQGFLAEAQKSYKAALDIAEKLSLQDPGNAGWQRDLYVSNYKIASTLQKNQQQPEANKYWRNCFNVLQNMKNKGMYLDKQMEDFYTKLYSFFNPK